MIEKVKRKRMLVKMRNEHDLAAMCICDFSARTIAKNALLASLLFSVLSFLCVTLLGKTRDKYSASYFYFLVLSFSMINSMLYSVPRT